MAFPYKTVLMVGSTSGIGLALAERMIDNGIFVIGVGRRKDRLDKFLAKHGPDKVAISQFDINELDKTQVWADGLIQTHPAIDCVILNSGVQRTLDFTRPKSIDLSLVQNETTTNYTSFVSIITAFLPHLQAQAPKPVALVTVTSGLAIIPVPRCANYCASKAALHSLTWTLRTQLAHDEASKHIRVVELIPPAVQTELHTLQSDLVAKGEGDMGIPLEEYIDGTWAGLLEGKDEVPVGKFAIDAHGVDAGRRAFYSHIDSMMGDPKAPYSLRGK